MLTRAAIISRQVGEAGGGEAIFSLGAFVANSAVAALDRVDAGEGQVQGQFFAAEQDVGLVQVVEGPNQFQVAVHRQVQQAFEIAKEGRRAVGKGV